MLVIVDENINSMIYLGLSSLKMLVNFFGPTKITIMVWYIISIVTYSTK